MFVGDQARLGVGFADARASLGHLARGGLLAEISWQTYAEGLAGLHGTPDAGPGRGSPRRAPGLPVLTQVRTRELVTRDQMAVLVLRWEAQDPAAGLFPALDADLTLISDPPATMLKLTGIYRPPPGNPGAGLDRAIWYQTASATIASFLGRIATVLSPTVLYRDL